MNAELEAVVRRLSVFHQPNIEELEELFNELGEVFLIPSRIYPPPPHGTSSQKPSPNKESKLTNVRGAAWKTT